MRVYFMPLLYYLLCCYSTETFPADMDPAVSFRKILQLQMYSTAA